MHAEIEQSLIGRLRHLGAVGDQFKRRLLPVLEVHSPDPNLINNLCHLTPPLRLNKKGIAFAMPSSQLDVFNFSRLIVSQRLQAVEAWFSFRRG
jgi:hypothetical protein